MPGASASSSRWPSSPTAGCSRRRDGLAGRRPSDSSSVVLVDQRVRGLGVDPGVVHLPCPPVCGPGEGADDGFEAGHLAPELSVLFVDATHGRLKDGEVCGLLGWCCVCSGGGFGGRGG